MPYDYLNVGFFSALANEALYCMSEPQLQQRYDSNVIQDLQKIIQAGDKSDAFSETLRQRRLSTDINTKISVELNKSEDNVCLIHLAVLKNNIDSARYVGELINAGAKVDSLTGSGWTAFCMASSSGNIDVARILMQQGANTKHVIGDKGLSPIHIAALKTHTEFVKFLALEAHVCINQQTENENKVTALHYAARNNDIEMVRTLLSLGAGDIDNEKVGSALRVAAVMGHEKIVELLVGCGFCVESVESYKSSSKTNLAKFCYSDNDKEIALPSALKTLIQETNEFDEKTRSFDQTLEDLQSLLEESPVLCARLCAQKFGINVATEGLEKVVETIVQNPSQSMITYSLTDLGKHPNEFKKFSMKIVEESDKVLSFDPLGSGPNVPLVFYPGTEDWEEINKNDCPKFGLENTDSSVELLGV